MWKTSKFFSSHYSKYCYHILPTEICLSSAVNQVCVDRRIERIVGQNFLHGKVKPGKIPMARNKCIGWAGCTVVPPIWHAL